VLRLFFVSGFLVTGRTGVGFTFFFFDICALFAG